MTRETTGILEEFNDDIQRVCEEVISLREDLEKAEDTIDNLRLE